MRQRTRQKKNNNEESGLRKITWCNAALACGFFFLADEVTLLRSLYTINVSSLSDKIILREYVPFNDLNT